MFIKVMIAHTALL